MTPRIPALVMVEIGFLFCVSSGVTFPWGEIGGSHWQELLAFVGQALFLPLCFFVAFYNNDLYNVRVVRNLFEFRKRIVKPLLFVFLLFFVFSLFTPPSKFISSALLSSFLLILVSIGIVFPLRWVFYTFGAIGPFAERILVLGTGELAWKVARAIQSISPVGYIIAGFVDDEEQEKKGPSPRPPSPVLGTLEHVEQIIELVRPDRIIVALRERRGRMPLSALLKAHWAGAVVEDGIKMHERFSGKLAVENLTPGFLIFSTDFRKPRIEALFQRIVSLVVAAMGLFLTAPLFVLIAVAIKLDSQGPIFFVQDRAGLHGRIFRLVKFRTMHSASAFEKTGSVWSRDLHSRVTRVGGWLRQVHLDELPQFFNILRGDMDLVGPRPEIADNIKTMEEHIPYYSLRMAVRPGVTGWAQVRYGYAVSQEDVTEKIRYDLYYIKHRSLWLDFHILLDTVRLILLGQSSLAAHLAPMEKSPEETTTDTRDRTVSSEVSDGSRPTRGVRAA